MSFEIFCSWYFKIMILHNIFAQKFPEGWNSRTILFQNSVLNVKLCCKYENYQTFTKLGHHNSQKIIYSILDKT